LHSKRGGYYGDQHKCGGTKTFIKVNLISFKAPLNTIAFSKALRCGNTQCYLQTSHACLYSPAAEHHQPLAGTHFTAPRRVKGWVDLGGWLHTKIKCRFRESNTDTVTYPSTKRTQRYSLIDTNALPLRQLTPKFTKMFTRCSQIIVDDFLISKVQYCNPFPMPGSRIKMNRPISPILTLKLVAMATSLERSENVGQILYLRSNSYHTAEFCDNRLSRPDIILPQRIYNFWKMRECTPTTRLNSGVTRQKFTKCTYHIVRSSQMDILKSEWQYSIHFGMPGLRIKVRIKVRFCQFWPLNWLPWQRPLSDLEKEGQIGNLLSNTYHTVKIWWKSVQQIWVLFSQS